MIELQFDSFSQITTKTGFCKKWKIICPVILLCLFKVLDFFSITEKNMSIDCTPWEKSHPYDLSNCSFPKWWLYYRHLVPKKGTGPLGQLSYSLWFGMIDRQSEVHKVTSISTRMNHIEEFPVSFLSTNKGSFISFKLELDKLL